MKSPDPKTIALLGVPFHDVTMDETLAAIDEIVRVRVPRYIATANLDFAAQASLDVELQRILHDAHLVLCDGTPLVWASRWLGNRLPERVTGADLVPKLIEVASAKRYRLFFLGGRPEVMARAVANVQRQYPDLEVTGYSPPF